MAVHRSLSIAALCLAASPAAAAGTLACVVHDRGLRLSLSGTYDYGDVSSLNTLEGDVEIRWDGTPKPFQKFTLNARDVQQAAIGNQSLKLDLIRSHATGRLVLQASVKISGERVATDPTTIRGTYVLEILSAQPLTTADKDQAAPVPQIKVMHTVTGYIECSAS
jgi:hypothetical protein